MWLKANHLITANWSSETPLCTACWWSMLVASWQSSPFHRLCNNNNNNNYNYKISTSNSEGQNLIAKSTNFYSIKLYSRILSVTSRNRRIWSTVFRYDARRSSCRNDFAYLLGRDPLEWTTTASVVYYLGCWTSATGLLADTTCLGPWKARPVT